MDVIGQFVEGHPGWQNQCRIGSRGFTAPKIEGSEMVEITNHNITVLAQYRCNIFGDFRSGNKVLLYNNNSKDEVNITFQNKAENNVILFKDGASESLYASRLHLIINGSNNIVVISPSWSRCNCRIVGDDNALFVGLGTSLDQTNFWLEGGSSIQIGDDCMFAWNVAARTSDAHSIFDTASGRVLNPPKSLVIGPHVWTAHDVFLLKGIDIGAGSIIGAGSTVTRSCGPRHLIAGSPAKIVKSGVTWTRAMNPSESQKQEAAAYSI